MPPVVTAGAMLTCSFGMAPTSLVVAAPRPLTENRPTAAVTDVSPANIPTFSMCLSLANPVTAGLTAAALGALTPGACVPVIAAPWIPTAPTTVVGGIPVLVMGSTCMCAYGGVVSIVGPPAVTVQAT